MTNRDWGNVLKGLNSQLRKGPVLPSELFRVVKDRVSPEEGALFDALKDYYNHYGELAPYNWNNKDKKEEFYYNIAHPAHPVHCFMLDAIEEGVQSGGLTTQQAEEIKTVLGARTDSNARLAQRLEGLKRKLPKEEIKTALMQFLEKEPMSAESRAWSLAALDALFDRAHRAMQYGAAIEKFEMFDDLANGKLTPRLPIFGSREQVQECCDYLISAIAHLPEMDARWEKRPILKKDYDVRLTDTIKAAAPKLADQMWVHSDALLKQGFAPVIGHTPTGPAALINDGRDGAPLR